MHPNITHDDPIHIFGVVLGMFWGAVIAEIPQFYIIASTSSSVDIIRPISTRIVTILT